MMILTFFSCGQDINKLKKSLQENGGSTNNSANICPSDAKRCPDGSSVVRDPNNNCEFLSCPGIKACTKDAKMCPDGSSVGRDPNNNCEFLSCPELKMCTMDARICPDGSSVGRDSKNNCEFFPCP